MGKVMSQFLVEIDEEEIDRAKEPIQTPDDKRFDGKDDEEVTKEIEKMEQ